MISSIIIFLLVTILLITLLKEVKSLKFLWKYHHVIGHLIPSWSFFAPVPNMLDYYLFYRTIDHNGKVYDWQVVNTISERRPFYSFLWNPNKRFSKGFLDISQDLLKICNEVKNINQICLSLPYMQILNFIDSFQHDEASKTIQFMIVSQSKLYEPEVVFLSELHTISRN